MDYVDFLRKHPHAKIIDASLVDIMGTLLGYDGNLNTPLYEAMEKAADSGKKIIIYSTDTTDDMITELHRKGVDFMKFHYVNKNALAQTGFWGYMVLGKVIDDQKPDDCLKLAQEEGWLYPSAGVQSDFETLPVPEGMEDRVADLLQLHL